MADQGISAVGIKRIVENCRNVFRRKENLEYYSEKDFKNAERKYVKYCLKGKPR